MIESASPNGDLENLLEFVKRSRRFDFTGYKRTTLQRRIAKRMHDVSYNQNLWIGHLFEGAAYLPR